MPRSSPAAIASGDPVRARDRAGMLVLMLIDNRAEDSVRSLSP
jgi:hypothetical protein